MPEELNDWVTGFAIVAGALGTGWLGKVVASVLRALRDIDKLGERVNAAVTVATMAKDTADSNTDRIIKLEEGNRLQWEPVQRALTELAHEIAEMARQMGDWRERESREMGEVSARLNGIDDRLDRYEKHIRPER